MRAMRGRGAAVALLLWAAGVVAARAEVRIERQPDGRLLMVNRPGSLPRLAAISLRDRSEIDRLIEDHARLQRLDPALVRAVVTVESSYDPSARSAKGAMGLMQLMPATARSLEVENPYDPEENLRGGTTYLRRLLDRFGGDLERALAGYNAGPEAVDRFGGLPPYPETHGYVDRVLRLFRGQGLAAVSSDELPGRRTYLHRDSAGRLIMTTARPTGS